MIVLRRVWWWLLPFYGWTGYSGEDGATPPPWYAFPLSWLYRPVNRLCRNPFGPRYTRDNHLVNAPNWKPWQ